MHNIPIILFIDLNGTIILADPVSGKDHEVAVNQFLAEKHEAVWGDHSKIPMPFKHYMEKFLAAGDREDLNIKKMRNNFYKNFINYLQKAEHELFLLIKSEYDTIMKVVDPAQGSVVPAFFKLIDYLEENKASYSIVLRTFGNDLDHIVKEIEAKCHLRFIRDVHINEEGFMHVNGNLHVNAAEMLEVIKPGMHFACQDNYKRWRNKKHAHEGGKPFPIARDKLTLFFDDHCLDKNILHVIYDEGFVSAEVSQRELQNQLIHLGRIVPVNILEAVIHNSNYFVEKLQVAIKTPLPSLRVVF